MTEEVKEGPVAKKIRESKEKKIPNIQAAQTPVAQPAPTENPFAMLGQLPQILQQFNKDVQEVKAMLVEVKTILKFLAPQR